MNRNRGSVNYPPNPSIEKVLEDQYTNRGIKWTLAYQCKVSPEELNKWRNEFWETRTQGNKQVWEVLKSAVDATPEDAEAIIKAAGLNAHAGVMTLVFDDQKFPYRVPIAWINDPVEYLPSDFEKLNPEEKPEEETYEGLKVRTVGEQDCTFDVSNYMTVSELKIKYLDDTNRSSYNLGNVIFLFGGRKLDDQLPLYSIYNMGSEMVIQWMLVNK